MQPPSLTAKPRKAVQTNKVCSCMLGSIIRRQVQFAISKPSRKKTIFSKAVTDSFYISHETAPPA